MKKKLLIACGVVALGLVGLVVSVILGINPLIKTAVEQGGAYALNVPTALGQADLALLSGDLELTGYAIDNPEGFKTPAVFAVDRIALKTDPQSLRTDVARIELIAMNAAHLSLEATRDGTNVGVLLDNLQRVLPAGGGEPQPEPAPSDEPTPEGPRQRFVIDRLEITGTKVTLSQSVVGDTTFELNLPDLILEQLGTEGAPVNLAELLDTTLQGLVVAVLNHEDLPPELRALLAGELDLSRLADALKAQLMGQLDGAQQRLDEGLARGRAALDQGAAELQGQLDDAEAQLDDAEAQAREQLDTAQADADDAKAKAQGQLDAAKAGAGADADDAKAKLGGLFGSDDDE